MRRISAEDFEEHKSTASRAAQKLKSLAYLFEARHARVKEDSDLFGIALMLDEMSRDLQDLANIIE